MACTCLPSLIAQGPFNGFRSYTCNKDMYYHQTRTRNGPKRFRGGLNEAPRSPSARAAQHNPPQQPRRHTTRPERAGKTQFPSQETQEGHRIHILATKGSMKPEETPSTAERALQK